MVSEEYENVTLMLDAPINVPPPKRGEIAEYIGRANYHSYEGNIIMDYGDGSLSYKNSLRFNPDGDNAIVRYQLNINLAMALEEMQIHFPGILSVIYQDVAPEDAHHQAMLGTRPKLN